MLYQSYEKSIEYTKKMAFDLALPRDHYVCHEHTELMDLLWQVLPVGEKKAKPFDEIRKEMGLPDADYIVNDPTGAFEEIYRRLSSAYR